MQQKVDQHTLEQTPVASESGASRGPVVLSIELLEQVAGGSSCGEWPEDGPAEQDDGVQSPRGGW